MEIWIETEAEIDEGKIDGRNWFGLENGRSMYGDEGNWKMEV